MTEQEQIKIAFEDLLQSLRKETSEESKQMITAAFEFANKAHAGVRRRSGDPYILHPIAVAKIATQEIGLGKTSVISALLHDVVEDTDYTVEDISNLFGPKVALIVDGLTKISGVMGSDTSKQAESFRKMILTLADDIRVILIKIADRLHNMRTLSSMPERKQVKIASETLYIYAPLAHRTGLHAIKTELEDLSMKYEHPEEYEALAKEIEVYKRQFSVRFEEFTKPIHQKLIDNGYEYIMAARTKSVYSVWMKMQRRHIDFDEIYDLLAVRIVFKVKDEQQEKSQCWNIFSLITDLYSPKPGRIRDWVSVPRTTGYEALHLTVMGPKGRWFEVQIRSERMDELAERGLATHWKYKGDGDGDNSELDRWLAGIKEILDQPDATALEFLDEFRLNLFVKEIRVFTPKGYMKTLPKGATALDFAYEIHSEIGGTCIGAKVNHKLVPMSHKLTSGDQVEILTSAKQKPQKEWLEFVVTAKARARLIDVFKKERKELIRSGRNIYEDVINRMGLPLSSEIQSKLLANYELANKNDLFQEIGKQTITSEDIVKILTKKSENKFIKYWNLQFLWSGKGGVRKKKGLKEKAIDPNSDFVIAPCCNPIPGDDVVGMNLVGAKVIVHKRSCTEAIRLMSSFGDKIVPVKWVSRTLMSFLAVIKITGIDTQGVVSEITALIAKEEKVSMRMIHFDARDGIFDGVIHLYVYNTADLNNIISRISELTGVETVARMETEEK